jgi:hypothetical protein
VTAPTLAPDSWLLAAALLTPDSPELPATPDLYWVDAYDDVWTTHPADASMLALLCDYTGRPFPTPWDPAMVELTYGPLREVRRA